MLAREVSASDLDAHFDMTFDGVSQHLRALRDAGLVIVRQGGTRPFYRAFQAALGPLAQYLESMSGWELATN